MTERHIIVLDHQAQVQDLIPPGWAKPFVLVDFANDGKSLLYVYASDQALQAAGKIAGKPLREIEKIDDAPCILGDTLMKMNFIGWKP